MTRISSVLVVFFTILAHAAVEHGTVFPITETSEIYSAEDNSFDTGTPSYVRFSYTPTKSGFCTVSTSYENSSFSRYLYYYGPGDTYPSSYGSYSGYNYGSGTVNYTFLCLEGLNYNLAVRTYYSSDYGEQYNIKASVDEINVTETVYPLSSTFVPYTYESNSGVVEGNQFAIKLSYEPATTGLYVLVSKAYYSRNAYYYRSDATFASRSASYSHSSGVNRTLFSLTAGETYYFAMYQNSMSYFDDTVSVLMAPSLKVNADTLGPGYVYVGTGSRNYDSTYIANDTVPLRAYVRSNSRFVKWEKVSGTCSIVNPTAAQTGVVISSNCKVRAVFKAGEVYAITKTAKKYNILDNYYSGTPSSGVSVRFSLVAPNSGAYVVKYTKDSTESSYLKRYPTGEFYSYDDSKLVTSSAMDTILLNAGDSVFYLVNSYYTRDSMMSFSMSYDTIPTIRLTIESESPRCSTNLSSIPVIKGQVAYVEAYAKEGYRPNGWAFVSGSHKFSDSTAYSIKDTIMENTKIKLRCKTANLIDITDKPKTYVVNKDFYDKSPGVGLRYRYEAPTSGIFVLRFQPYNLYGMYRYYGSDSTFKTAKRSNGYTSSKVSFNVAATGSEKVYASTEPYSTDYWDDSVSVVALRGGTVKVDGKTKVDTLAVGDSLSVTASLDSGDHFAKWTVVSGKGAFVDSTERSTSFILKGATSTVIKPVFTTLPLYELTNQYKGYTFKNNSTYSERGYYGIRAFVNPRDSGLYAILMKTVHSSYIYNFGNDSTFDSYSTSGSCAAGTVCKMLLNLNARNKRYFQFVQNSTTYLGDSVWIRAIKTSHLYTDTSGTGYAYIGASGSRMYDSTFVAGDTVPVRAYTTDIDHRFSKWSVVSGSCKIIDSTKAVTSIIPNGDCKVKAHFIKGTVYPITDVSTKYTLVDNYYSRSPSYGVRFMFTAPATGQYAISIRSLDLSMTVEYDTTCTFNTYKSRTTSTKGKLDQLGLMAGQSVCYTVKNYVSRDTLQPLPFWISYSQSKASLTLVADSNGTVSPTGGYSPAWLGTAYPITATAKTGFRFNKWIVESGTASIDDPNAYKTMAIPADTTTIRATFKRGSVYELTATKKSYNVQLHHYADDDTSTTRFRWTPSDTNHYLLKVDSITGKCFSYGMDSLFSSSVKTYDLNGSSYILLQGMPGKTYYYAIKDTTQKSSRLKDFAVQLITPYVMFVESTRGRTVPSGNVYVAPGVDTALYAIPYGGYVFDSWTKVKGTVRIDDASSARTRIEPQSSFCHIKANYVFDLSAEPEVTITNLDLSNHPGICAQVSVVDKNNGKPIAGLDSTDFVLFQDNKSLPAQTTTIESVGGVSVALVVDESGSMSGTKMAEAKNSIRQFINEMGPYDRTAIVGFTGGSNAQVHQAMTSDKELLLNAVDRLAATGDWTNINKGTMVGVEQLVGETNPTAVIVFSDGANNSDVYTSSEVVARAITLQTNIYSIAVATTSYTTLKELADGTGGTFSTAPTASQLSDIYTTIRSSVQARYILCYQSPDAVWNGDTHTVVVKTKFLNKDASDTAYWDESSQPPIVELTDSTWKLVGVNQPQYQSLTISVIVKSKSPIKDVRLFAREVSLRNDAFKSYAMTQVDDTLWHYIIPDSSVTYPGIDFYVVATDSNELTGKTPSIMSPAKEPYTIPVKNDVPDIRLDSVACVDTTGGKGSLRFKITDDNGVNSATLFYKDSAVVLFDERLMSESRGYWTGYIPAKAFENGIIEYYVRAVDELGASARWHKKENSWIPVCNRKIRVADVEDSIAILNDNVVGESITRETSKLRLQLVTEDFSTGKDTVTAKLSCLVSGDIENDIKLVEKRSGYYETPKSIAKNEYSAKRDDGSISCSGRDTLIAEYKDPLYGTYARDTVIIDDSTEFSYRFLDAAGKKDLDSLESGDSAQFKLRVTSFSKSIHIKDTIEVLLLTDDGDSLWVKAVETGNFTSVFEYSGTFYFVYDKKNLERSKLDALFDLSSSYNRVVITAKGKNDKLGKKRDSLVVYSNYNPADIAEIYDADKDGEADSIRIHYVAKQKDGVVGIDSLYWNKAGGTWQSVSKKSFHLQKDSSWVEARLEDSFDYGATAADKDEAPYLKLTKPKGGFAQKLDIKDRVGAVPVKAFKRPGTVSIKDFMECSNQVPPDTLEITLSEPVKNIGKDSAWTKLFTYSEDCKDTLDYSLNIAKLLEKDSVGLVWKFVLRDHNIMTYNCIRTNPKATYVDKYDNAMGRGGVNIDGSNGNLYLYEVIPAPAVSGVKSNAKWIAPGEHDWSRVPDTLSVIRVASIMPYKAYVTIFDNYSNVVTTFTRKFGDDGEMTEKIRGNDRNHAKTGFLHWNNRSDDGRKVGTGVYIWRIDFKFKDGHSEFRLVKTGVKRKK